MELWVFNSVVSFAREVAAFYTISFDPIGRQHTANCTTGYASLLAKDAN